VRALNETGVGNNWQFLIFTSLCLWSGARWHQTGVCDIKDVVLLYRSTVTGDI